MEKTNVGEIFDCVQRHAKIQKDELTSTSRAHHCRYETVDKHSRRYSHPVVGKSTPKKSSTSHSSLIVNRRKDKCTMTVETISVTTCQGKCIDESCSTEHKKKARNFCYFERLKWRSVSHLTKQFL